MYRHNINIFYATQFLHSLIFTIPIWIIYYQARINALEISLLVTIQYITQVIMELPSGALADLIGRKKTIVVGFLTGAFSMLLFPLASNFYHFLVLAILVGISDSFRSGSEEAILYDTHKQCGQVERFDQVYANSNNIYQIGLVTASALGGLLFSINQHLPYLLYGLSLAIGTILSSYYIEPFIDSEKFSPAIYLKQMKAGIKEVFKNHYTSTLSLFYVFVGGIAWSSTLYFNEYLMVELIPQNTSRGIITAIMRLINVFLITMVLKKTKLFKKQQGLVLFPIIMLAAYLPGFMLSGFIGIPFVQAAMIATSARWIILAPLTNATFSSKYRATAISVLSLLIGIVYITITGISGIVITHLGIKMMYSLLGIITLLTVIPVTVNLLKAPQPQPNFAD